MKYDKNQRKNNPTMDDDYLFSASAQDCTGLIPSGEHDDSELENYEEIYPYLPHISVPPPDIISPPETGTVLPLSAGFPPKNNQLL